MAVYKKDPAAVLDYTFDWSGYLTPLADLISTVTWVTTGGITATTGTHTTNTATTFVSGGTAGTNATLTCRITTSGGRTDDRTITLKILDR
jgi:hypothetical protein